MFGIDHFLRKAHIVSHLIVALGDWLTESDNPILDRIPDTVKPEIIAAIRDVVEHRQSMIADDKS